MATSPAQITSFYEDASSVQIDVHDPHPSEDAGSDEEGEDVPVAQDVRRDARKKIAKKKFCDSMEAALLPGAKVVQNMWRVLILSHFVTITAPYFPFVPMMPIQMICFLVLAVAQFTTSLVSTRPHIVYISPEPIIVLTSLASMLEVSGVGYPRVNITGFIAWALATPFIFWANPDKGPTWPLVFESAGLGFISVLVMMQTPFHVVDWTMVAYVLGALTLAAVCCHSTTHKSTGQTVNTYVGAGLAVYAVLTLEHRDPPHVTPWRDEQILENATSLFIVSMVFAVVVCRSIRGLRERFWSMTLTFLSLCTTGGVFLSTQCDAGFGRLIAPRKRFLVGCLISTCYAVTAFCVPFDGFGLPAILLVFYLFERTTIISTLMAVKGNAFDVGCGVGAVILAFLSQAPEWGILMVCACYTWRALRFSAREHVVGVHARGPSMGSGVGRGKCDRSTLREYSTEGSIMLVRPEGVLSAWNTTELYANCERFIANYPMMVVSPMVIIDATDCICIDSLSRKWLSWFTGELERLECPYVETTENSARGVRNAELAIENICLLQNPDAIVLGCPLGGIETLADRIQARPGAVEKLLSEVVMRWKDEDSGVTCVTLDHKEDTVLHFDAGLFGLIIDGELSRENVTFRSPAIIGLGSAASYMVASFGVVVLKCKAKDFPVANVKATSSAIEFTPVSYWKNMAVAEPQ